MIQKENWCEHLDKASKYTILKYDCGHKTVCLRIQSWFCAECGVHGAVSELIPEGKEPLKEAEAG